MSSEKHRPPTEEKFDRPSAHPRTTCRVTASEQEEQALIEQRRLRNLPWDLQPIDAASIRDLDLDVFRHKYLPAAVAADILQQNHRSTEQQLAALRLLASDMQSPNPGGPYGQVTPENFGNPGITNYRNPTVAEVMRNLDFVQRFGVGITLARQELATNGNPPPEFLVSTTNVLAILRKAA